MQLIITADDYGPVEYINKGIEKALELKCINTVSALINPHKKGVSDTTYAIKELNSKFPDVKIGIHLSITSGYPILNGSDIDSLVDKTGRFYPMHEFDYEKIDPNQVKKEIIAQIEAFKSTNIRLDHINCHHGVLYSFPNLFPVYVEVANQFNLHLRQPLIISRTKRRHFRRSKMKWGGYLTAIRLLDDIWPWNMIKNLKHNLKLKKTISHTEFNQPPAKYFIDTYYRRASDKNLRKILKYFPTDGKSEMVVHLGDGELPHGLDVPNGITYKHLPDRHKELNILTKYPNIQESLLNQYSINLDFY